MSIHNQEAAERLRRWRLLLGSDADQLPSLNECDQKMDRVLQELYSLPPGQTGGRGKSMPHAAKWLGEIKQLFPSKTVEVIQKDAVKRLDMSALLQDPEFLEQVEADIHMVAQLISLKDYIPDQTLAIFHCTRDVSTTTKLNAK
jgi:hypothetical protein